MAARGGYVEAGPLSVAGEWLQTHDRGYVALRRAVRTALIMPAMFALGTEVIGNPVLGTFAAFGAFAMLLLVDFSGSIRDRLFDQSALGVTCAVLICLGTLASRTAWLAAVSMAIVGFLILFAGVVSSVIAGATTSLLLSFILPVTLAGSVSSIPDRVAGWGLAAAASLLAISLIWPSPAHNPVRAAAIDTCRALAARLRAEIAFVTAPSDEQARQAQHAAIARADEAVHSLQRSFFATPYRPTGLSTDARAVIRMVDELRWLNGLVLRSALVPLPRAPDRHVCAVKLAGAEVLERAADRLEAPRSPKGELAGALDRLHRALRELERATTTIVPSEATSAMAPIAGEASAGTASDREAARIVSALDPSFRAQELSFVVAQVATNAEFAAAATGRSWLERVLGRQPPGIQGPVTAAQQRAGSHIKRHSLWLHNSLRGAVALGLAVLVADLSGVQHGFWVVLGTLAVLRSNALNTGQNLVRALAGTTAGFVAGGVLVYLAGTDTAVLWVMLPIAILLAGLAPSTISFAAGQAAFTLTLVILFNIVAPAGWTVGLVRVEDVALGGAVSLAVGLMFWPRGAGAALGRALAEGYSDSARYLADAVAYGIGRCDATAPAAAPPREQATRAAAAARRLDDTFRGYVTERGVKPTPLAKITGLVTGVAGLRLAADAVLELWDDCGPPEGERAAARGELLSAVGNVTGWYQRFAAGLTGRGELPDPLPPDAAADRRLVAAVDRDLRDTDGGTTATGVRVIWTGDHLDAVRRLQESLVAPARTAVADQALDPTGGVR